MRSVGLDYAKIAHKRAKTGAKTLRDKDRTKGVRSYKGSKVTITIEEKGLYCTLKGKFPTSVVDKATSFAVKGARYSPNYQSGRWDGRTHFLKRPSNRLPLGLLHLAIPELEKRDIEVEIIDLRKDFYSGYDPPTVKLLPAGFELREYQKECIAACYRAGRGIIHAATNSGKTECFCGLARAYGTSFKILFLVRGIELLDQSIDRFSLRLGIPVDQIGRVGDSSCTFGHWITVATPDTLYSRKDQLSIRNFLDSIQIVVLDECHKASSATFVKILEMTSAPYRFGMSGTPLSRSDGADMKLMAQTGPVIFKITNAELVRLGYSVPVTIEFIRVTTPELPKGLTYANAVKEGIVGNFLRNRKVCQTALDMFKEGRQVLILVQRISHGNALDKMLWSLEPSRFIPHTFISGKEDSKVRREALQNFKDGKLQILIASTILDEGIDVPAIDGLILAGGGKAKIGALQRIGRGLRTGGKFDNLRVADFADMTNYYLAKHSLERLKIYRREKAFRIIFSEI